MGHTPLDRRRRPSPRADRGRPRRRGRIRAAVATLEGSPARLGLAHALVDLGADVRRRRAPVEARPWLERGMELAHACGATRLAEHARTELAATGVRPRRAARTGSDALTASELRVAELAASGLTNRTIAQSLFVTQRTVETHLGHVVPEAGPLLAGALARGARPPLAEAASTSLARPSPPHGCPSIARAISAPGLRLESSRLSADCRRSRRGREAVSLLGAVGQDQRPPLLARAARAGRGRRALRDRQGDAAAAWAPQSGIAGTGQSKLPAIQLEDGSWYRKESSEMAEGIRAGACVRPTAGSVGTTDRR